MKKTTTVVLFFTLCLLLLTQQIFPLTLPPSSNAIGPPADISAQALVRAAVEAMGGEAKIKALKSIKFEKVGHAFALEQSERPEGPWLVNYQQVTELRDVAGRRVRKTSQMRTFLAPQWTPPFTQIIAGGVTAFDRDGKFFPANALDVPTTEQNLALAPEQIFLTALGAADLRLDKDTVLQSVPQKVIKFTWQKVPVTIYLNAGTNLPTAVDTVNASPYDYYWGIWGDYTERTYYTLWTLGKGGLRYPQQADIQRNGTPFSSFTITKVEYNVPFEEKEFTIPDDIRQRLAAMPKPIKINDGALGRADRPGREIAPGIYKYSGAWDVAMMKQADGVVIIESPISSGYSAKTIAEAKRRFPGAKIKAVITTSDAFPHFGGAREYAAQGIPIYALDANRPILERLFAAPHTFEPDALQLKPRKADLKIVSGKTVIGSGAERIELYPIRSESGERMIMVYFPEQQLLYASDLIQRQRDGSFFMPQYVTEVIQAAAREKLAVKTVFAMHAEPMPFADLVNAVEKHSAVN